MINRVFGSFIGLAFVAVYILGHFEEDYVIPSILGISLVSIGLGYLVFSFNKKQLSQFGLFIRQGLSVKLLLPMILPLIAYFPFEYFIDDYFELTELDGAPFYFYLPLGIGLFLGGIHQNFMNAIKIHQSGLAFPGFNHTITPWHEVKNIKREAQEVTIETVNTTKSFKILAIDNKHIDSIISQLNNRR